VADAGALERLDERYRLPAPAPARLAVLADLLVNDPVAPTSLRDKLRVVEDHLADSLVALELDVVRDARAVADLGSGAGVPGLPLAIALPQTSFALVESNRRKCAFIDRAIAACELDNTTAINTRVEAWPEGIGRFDLATARALAPLAVVAEYAAPLLREGGVAVVWRGRRDPADEVAATAACKELGLEPREVRRVHPYDGAQHRHLHLMSKVMDTPERFPRRSGMAAKSPLGARR
jgi:16S rRNA (guanine527-N7)-methyltransferase